MTVESNVRALFSVYVANYVNTRVMLQDDPPMGKAHKHLIGWICDHYEDRYKPPTLEWNMGLRREVTAHTHKCIAELLGGQEGDLPTRFRGDG
jgi:hypothetical protein